MDLQVVGAGEMGRWFARAVEADAPAPISVTFTDVDPDTAAAAAHAHCDDARARPASEAPRTDVVCVAVPIPAAPDSIATATERAEEAVLDLTGTMTDPVEVMAANATGLEQLSLHPLFAPDNEPGNVAVVPVQRGPVTDIVRETLTTRGNEWFETTPEAHDEAMDTVQARTHTAVLAFALAGEDVDDRFHTPISKPLSELVDQVTDGDPHVYADVQSAFDGADDVATAARRLADADRASFEALYEDARR